MHNGHVADPQHLRRERILLLHGLRRLDLQVQREEAIQGIEPPGERRSGNRPGILRRILEDRQWNTFVYSLK
jgi:hypothetical protein